MRLLVVEDDRDLNRQVATALEGAGYAVDRAYDGEEGWFLGDTEPYDAIVLDIGLPKRDGVSVLTAWRKSGRVTPVLILTGRRDDAWLASWSRADAVVPHPIDGVALAPAVADLMRRRLAHVPVR